MSSLVGLTVVLSIALLLPNQVHAQRVIDGFNVYCTSNLDGTGVCTNMETSRNLDCMIIPGQVIDCKSKSGKSFQCVIYSQYTTNQAEFYCDPSAERLLLQEGELDGGSFTDPLREVL